MKRAKFLLIAFLIFIFFFSCRNEASIQRQTIAQVGNREITPDEFRLFYELDPNFGIDSTGYPALLDELDKQVDQVLSSIKGRKEGLFDDSTFVMAREWERHQAMLRQLYREVIEKNVEISEQELRQAYLHDNIKVHARHLFSPDLAQAEEWHRKLITGASFDALAPEAFKDTTLSRSGGDLGWIKLGELDEDFAAGIEKLKQGEISEPVRTRWGYHVIQLLDRQDEVVLSQDDFARQKPSLRKKLERRKKNQLSALYIAEFMRDRNPQPNRATFRLFWSALASGEDEKAELSSTRMFTNELIRGMKARLKPHLKDALISYNGGNVSLGEYLDGLKKIPVSNRPRFRTPRQLSDKMGIWVRDEFLLPEAERRNLQNHPTVMQEVRDFAEEQSYLYFLQNEIDRLPVDDATRNYFAAKGKNKSIPDPRLKRFHTLQEWQWWKAQGNLHRELRKLSVPVTIDSLKLQQVNREIDWKGRIRMFAIRKPE